MYKKIAPHIKYIFAFIIISAITVFIYSVSLDGPFVFDDYQDIKQNPNIRLGSLSFSKLYQAAFNSPAQERPVSNLTFAVNYYFDGLNVRGYHWVNIFVHIINGYLVYLLTVFTLRLNENNNGRSQICPINNTINLCALFTALIFVCHPLQTQSVSFIVQRMTSLAAMFYFLALIFYIKGRLLINFKYKFALYATALLSWLLALGAKQNAAMLPVIVMLYEWYFFQDMDRGWIKKNIKYFIGVLILFVGTTLIYLGDNPLDRIMNDYEYREFTMSERVLTQFRVISFYFSLLFYPHPSRLNLLHDFSISQSLFAPITTLYSLILLSGLLGYALVTARKHKIISFCILWIFINLAIESSIIALELIYEHRLYLPMFAFAFGTSFLLFRFLSNKKSILYVSVIIIITLLATGTYMRNKIWANPITLWSDVISKSPNNHRGHYNYANILAKHGRSNEAIQHFQLALEINPDLSRGYKMQARKYFHHGNALLREGDIERAIDNYIIAKNLDPFFAEPHNNLGNVLVQQGNIDEAFKLYSKAIELNPEYDTAHVNIGNLYVLDSDLENACSHYRYALQLNHELNEVKDYFNIYCIKE